MRIVSLTAAVAVVSLAGCWSGDAASVRVSVAPESVELVVGTTQQFEAASRGSFERELTWSVVSGGGTVDATGLYTAPSDRVAGDVAVVRAASRVAPSRYAEAAVRLVDPPLVPRVAQTAGGTEIQVLRSLPSGTRLFLDGVEVAAESAPGGTLRFVAPPHARGPVELRVDSPGRDPESWSAALRYVPTSFRLSGGTLVRPCTGDVADLDLLDVADTGAPLDEIVVLCEEPAEIVVLGADSAQGVVHLGSFPLEANAHSWTAGDVFGDSRPEIVVTIDRRIYIVRFDDIGIGSEDVLVAPIAIEAIAIADADVKAGRDLVAVGQGDRVVLFSQIDPVDLFEAPSTLFSSPSIDRLTAIDFADLDGVPPMDFAVAGDVKPSDSAVVLVRQQGIAVPTSQIIPTRRGVSGLRFADVVADTKTDIVVTISSKAGGGGAVAAQFLDGGAGFVPQDIGVGALEFPDLWVRDDEPYLTQSNGGEVLFLKPGAALDPYSLGTLWRGFSRLAVGDVDGDAEADLLLGGLLDARGLLVIEPGIAVPASDPPAFGPSEVSVPIPGLIAPSIVGMRRDTAAGEPVAVLRESDSVDGGVAVVDVEGGGAIRAVAFAGTSFLRDAFLEDITNDGIEDIVAATPTGLRIAEGQGTGTFPPTVLAGDFAVQFPSMAAAASGLLDGDGLPDLVVGATTTGGDTVYGILWGDGSAKFDPADLEVLRVVATVGLLVVADLDLDGHHDVIATDQQAATVSIHRSRGDRQFDPPLVIQLERPATLLTVADVDLDMVPDLVLVGSGLPGYSLDEIYVYLGRDGLLLRSSTTQVPTIGIKEIDIADLDGDLLPDLILLAPQPALAGGAQLVQVFHGLGTGQFGSRFEFSCGRTGVGSPIAIGVITADVDGDGLEDLLCAGNSGLRTRRNLSQ